MTVNIGPEHVTTLPEERLYHGQEMNVSVEAYSNLSNETFIIPGMDFSGDYIFNRVDVRIALILAYTFVFCNCFFGNLLVIIVVVVHRRMRTVTNFFLANLAFADLCVGMFCVYQNLSFYLTTHWSFGDFLCKMYHFVHSMSYTASIAILMVICIERYIAIVHPMWSKQVITLKRLRIVIVAVWVLSATYCSPRLIMYGTIEVPSMDGEMETICILRRSLYNSKVYDLVNFVICFVLPVVIITILYFIIGIRLWNSGLSAGNKQDIEMNKMPDRKEGAQNETKLLCCSSSGDQKEQLHGTHIVVVKGDGGRMYMETRSSSVDITKVTFDYRAPPEKLCPNDEGSTKRGRRLVRHGHPNRKSKCKSNSGFRPLQENYQNSAATTILQARRKVIRLLVVVVFTFVACNLPFHARKLWQYWSSTYDGTSNTAALLTIFTTLILYMNSGINPIIYAFLSDNFRKSMKDVLLCRHRQRFNRQNSSRSTLRITQTSVWQPDHNGSPNSL